MSASRTRLGVGLLVVIVLTGCVQRSRFKPPSGGPVDEAIVFYELDAFGSRVPLSQETKIRKKDTPDTLRERRVDQIPNPGLVDQDSMIHVLLKKDRLTTRSNGDFLAGEEFEALQERKKRLNKALVDLDGMIGARATTVKAYEDETEDFFELKRNLGRSKSAFFRSLGELFPEPQDENAPAAMTEKFNQLDEALKADRKFANPSFSSLRGLLQSEIDEIAAADREIEREARTLPKLTLTLQAFLQSPGKDPSPIHVPGYDSLNDGQLVRIDRAGLDLSDEEMARLTAQMTATRKIAATANKVKNGEASLREGFLEAAHALSPDLGALADRVDALSDKFTEEALTERVDRAKVALDALSAKIEADAADLGDSILSETRAMPDELVTRLRDNSGTVAEALVIVAEARGLADRWSNATGSGLDSLVTDSLRLLRRVEGFTNGDLLPNLAKDARTELRSFLQQKGDEFTKDVLRTIEKIIDGPEMADLMTELDSFLADINEAVAIVKDAERVLGITKASPIDTNLRNSEAFNVPIDELKDTHIDLQRTPRTVGDYVTVSAVLSEDNREIDSSTASFKVERFGWFAKLSPAVVLVTPEDDNDSTVFAPTLSWMHHNVPRATNDAWYAPTLRALEPALGIHSAFLSFDNDTAVEIGLGGTLSFWENRLQVGAGYNLMGDSENGGRVYYFIGSDLIGLLQTVGVQGLP